MLPELQHKQLKGSVEKGDRRFNSPKSSKVKKVFSLLNKAVRLNFSSYKCKLLKFSLTALLTSKSTFLTFDLLGLLKCLSPFSTEPFNCTKREGSDTHTSAHQHSIPLCPRLNRY